jgi:hypothetical protein
MEYKTGQTVYEYDLQIYENGKVEKNTTEHEILIIKDHDKRGKVIAISDDYSGIEVLQTVKDKDKMSISIEDYNIWENKWRSKSLTDSIRGNVYTGQKDSKKVFEKLKKEMEKYLNKEYGKYCSYKMILEDVEI